MADPRGFLKNGREVASRRPVDERVNDWNEVYPEGVGRALLPIITKQAGRCMDCGIPFCHQGCPLGNIIPEWNDLVWRDDWEGAIERLHATNNFPEFTGRLCPAPCETACVLGINQDPVTIKNVEVAIVDRAWELRLVRPAAAGVADGQDRGGGRLGPGGTRRRPAADPGRSHRRGLRARRQDRRAAPLRHPRVQDGEEAPRPAPRPDAREGTVFRAGVNVGADVTGAQLRDRYDAVVLAIGATCRATCRSRAGSSAASTRRWSSCRSPTARRSARRSRTRSTATGKHVVIIGGGDTGADCLGTSLRQGAALRHAARDHAAPR